MVLKLHWVFAQGKEEVWQIELYGNVIPVMQRVNQTISGFVIIAMIALAMSTPVTASTSLGAADGWNAMIFTDLDAYADTEGRLAVGGNMTMHTGYSVGVGTGYGPSEPQSYGAEDYLAIGGDLDTNNMGIQIYGGNARVGGSVTGNVSFNHSSNQLYQNVGAGNVGVDFAAAKADLTAQSQYLSTFSQTGTTLNHPWQEIRFTDNVNDIVVFNVVASELHNQTRYLNVNPGATVIFNVSGTDVTIEGHAWSVNGNWSDKTNAYEADILYNFYEAERVNFAQMNLPGSVLAPNAHLSINGGGINGQTIANSASQRWGGQFNNYTFDGNLPAHPGNTGAQIPSPAAVWAGLALLGSLTLRRRRSA